MTNTCYVLMKDISTMFGEKKIEETLSIALYYPCKKYIFADCDIVFHTMPIPFCLLYHALLVCIAVIGCSLT